MSLLPVVMHQVGSNCIYPVGIPSPWQHQVLKGFVIFWGILLNQKKHWIPLNKPMENQQIVKGSLSNLMKLAY